MAIIYLIRHGQASFNADNYDQLSDKGYQQAALLGGYLKQKVAAPSTIITGSMARHQQTATNCLETFVNLPDIQHHNGWNEYDHQNILATFDKRLATPTGIRQYLAEFPQQQFKTLFMQAMTNWINNEGDYNESFNTFSQRILSAVQQLVNLDKNSKVLIFTSGGPISLVSCKLLGLPLEKFIDINWSLVNCGITKIITRSDTKQLTLSSLNEHHIFESNDKKLITYT